MREDCLSDTISLHFLRYYKMRASILLLLIATIVHAPGFAQYNDSTLKYSYFGRVCGLGRSQCDLKKQDSSCKGYYLNLAKEDIATGEAKLLCRGGYAWNMYVQDSLFEKKYHITYIISGCIPDDHEECQTIYNIAIFRSLDAKYHRRWRMQVRKDVVGFRKNIFRRY